MFSRAGNYTAAEDTSCSSDPTNDDTYGPTPFMVRQGLSGSISVTPDPPVVDQQAQLSATQTGGNSAYTYSWDLNNDGTFGDSTLRQPYITFTTAGPHTVSVKISDTGAGHRTKKQRVGKVCS